MNAGGVRLFFRAVGTGRDTLVGVHGDFGFTLDYSPDDFLPLTDRHTLIFYDQRGTGRSSLVATPPPSMGGALPRIWRRCSAISDSSG